MDFLCGGVLDQQLSNLHGVQRCTLAQVIAGNNKNKTLVVISGLVLADATDENFINAGAVGDGL